MARPRAEAPSLTPHQASFVLESAVADGKLSAADVRRYLDRLPEHVSMLEAQLARLKGVIVEPVKRMLHREEKASEPISEVPPTKKQRRKKRISAERKASMQMQGKYLGLLTRLPQNQRAKYKAMAKKDGREAAIAAMEKAGK